MNIAKLLKFALFHALHLGVVEAGGGAPEPDYGNDFTPDGEDAPEAPPAPLEAPAVEEKPAAEAPEAPAVEDKPADESRPSPMIPKARFDEVLAKNKELQAQLQARQEQQQAAQSVEGLQDLESKIDSLQEKYEEAVMDGDSALARQLRTEIRSAQQQYNTAFAQQTQAATIQQLQAKAAWDATLAKVEADFPALNEDSDHFNAELAGEVLELMNAYRVTGMSAHDALAKAAKLVVGSAAPVTPVEPQKTPEQVAQEEAAAKIAAAEAKAADRKAGAVAKNVAAAQATPPSLHDTGRDSDTAGTHRVSEMSEREFAQLRKDEAALARARGDLV